MVCLCINQNKIYFLACVKVKKRQLRARFLLDSYKIKYEMVDISDPSPDNAEQRDKMLQVAKRRNESNPPFPPQFFNEDDYCGVSFFLFCFVFFVLYLILILLSFIGL